MQHRSDRKMPVAPREGDEAHPTEGAARPPEVRAGVEAIMDAVRDVHWPATLDDIRRAAGDTEVATSKITHYPLNLVLDAFTHDRFPDRGAFKTELLASWPRIESLEFPSEQRFPPNREQGAPGRPIRETHRP